MHPKGILVIPGYGAYQMYYKQALDTLRVDWHVFRVGTYKSAVEPYLRDDMSEADREALANVIDQLWVGYKQSVEAARALEPGTKGELARVALDFGLVDGLWTREQIRDRMIEIAGENGEDSAYPVASLDDYLRQMRGLRGNGEGDRNVAVVVASGEILDGTQPPGVIGGDSTAQLLRRAREDDSVKAVVLRVDSPGGSTFASEVIRNEVDELKAAGKPVVASMSSLAASAGYWISAAADRIYANPSTLTGSIGIFAMFPTFPRSLDAIGIHVDGVGNTPWSGQLRPDRPLSDDVRAIIQMSVDNGYDDFVTGVADRRGMSKEAVDRIAQGRIWTGDDAMANGLIDEFGELDAAVAAAAALAELDEGDYGTKYFDRELDPGEQLLLDLLGGAKSWGMAVAPTIRPRPSLDRLADIVDGALSPLTRFNDPRGLYSHCFCAFE